MLVRDTIIAGSAANRRRASREDSDKWRLKRGRREKEATQRGAPCHSSLFLNTLRTTSHDDQNSGHLRHVWVTPSEFRRRTHRRWRKEEKRRGKTVRNEDRPVGMDTRAGKERNKEASERRERNRTRKSEWEESVASAAREHPRIRDESLNRKGFESIAGTVYCQSIPRPLSTIFCYSNTSGESCFELFNDANLYAEFCLESATATVNLPDVPEKFAMPIFIG